MKMFIVTAMAVGLAIACSAQESKPTKPPQKARSLVVGSKPQPVKLDPDGKAHPPSVWMQQKLKHSQDVFAAMVEGNLVRVQESAQFLKLINRLESFVRGRAPEYRAQLKMFQFANDEIIKGAEENNLERVILGYNQLSISCVSCHKQLRKP